MNDDFRFNVYGVDDKQSIYPLYNSKNICDNTCNLLLIENHYVWIKDFDRLMNTQSKDGHKLFSCYYCLQHFTSENVLKNHTEVCLKINGTQEVKMPCKNKNTFFMNYHKQLMAPFVIYADFECITVPINEEHGKQTVAYQEHKACGYGYKIVCQYDDKYSKSYKGYRGENAVYKLIENLLEEQKEIKSSSSSSYPFYSPVLLYRGLGFLTRLSRRRPLHSERFWGSAESIII